LTNEDFIKFFEYRAEELTKDKHSIQLMPYYRNKFGALALIEKTIQLNHHLAYYFLKEIKDNQKKNLVEPSFWN
jgi:hypothetical protein